MAILNLDTGTTTTTNSKVDTNHNYASKEVLKAGAIFNKDQNITNILQYVSGSKWQVDYFIQILDINDTPTNPDINIPNTVQSYNRIDKLDLIVQSEIPQGSVTETFVGDAIINSGIIPHVGDAFRATLLGNREAIFVINDVVKKTYDIHDVYDVTFKLFVFLDTDTVVYNDLIYKTVKEYIYDKDFLADFSSPIILSKDYKAKLDLKDVVPKILDYYLNIFINRDLNILALPTTASVYIDVFLNRFLKKIVNTSSNTMLAKLNIIDYETPKIHYTIWDVILERNPNAFSYVEKELGFIYTPAAGSIPNLRHIGYLGINFLVDNLYGALPTTPSIIENPNISPTRTALLGTDLNSYLFTDTFYSNGKTTGLLEECLQHFINNETISDTNINTLISEYPTWSRLEQFYFIPLLLLLINDKIQYTYKSI